MSRIGLMPIEIPEKVEISVDDKNVVKVKGPKGELEKQIGPAFEIKIEDGVLHVVRPDETKENRSKHGLYRSLIANMVEGVTEGYSKKLQIVGTGYRAQMKGNDLLLNLGFSHDITVKPEENVSFEVSDALTIIVSGIDKEAVGRIAANIRDFRLPEPYKGKGIHYEGEHIRRKEGKTGK